ncbi:hypothetical protein IQ230_18655 [Gloeocapsopsis crepidinum LEGE 06123]|uniref:Uncharacterized protein n=1 Tax=Gloeocapsopsis crepidinum LEGE 06123 TaxID=588587 RepID=A0ABR9UVK7_9CHRO|nr:hypothetical protein [Gloeocapsopsis crepidinum]MBE9192333.1 hypothetical protein [Gloeocapsopsis crepidinum LEGE 06123]
MIEIIEKANQLKLDKPSNGIKRAVTTKQKNKKLIFRSISKSNIGDCYITTIISERWLQLFLLPFDYQIFFKFSSLFIHLSQIKNNALNFDMEVVTEGI